MICICKCCTILAWWYWDMIRHGCRPSPMSFVSLRIDTCFEWSQVHVSQLMTAEAWKCPRLSQMYLAYAQWADIAMMITIPARFEPFGVEESFRSLTLFCLSIYCLPFCFAMRFFLDEQIIRDMRSSSFCRTLGQCNVLAAWQKDDVSTNVSNMSRYALKIWQVLEISVQVIPHFRSVRHESSLHVAYKVTILPLGSLSGNGWHFRQPGIKTVDVIGVQPPIKQQQASEGVFFLLDWYLLAGWQSHSLQDMAWGPPAAQVEAFANDPLKVLQIHHLVDWPTFSSQLTHCPLYILHSAEQ